MPLYEYQCDECGEEFTLLQSISADQDKTQCEHCDSTQVRRKFSSFASKVIGGTPKTSKPVSEKDYPNQDVFKLPIPRLRSEL